MKKWQFIILIFLIVCINACDKSEDEEIITYPITYVSSSISESEIKVYTEDGELPTKLKNSFIERYKSYITNIDSIDGIAATYLSEDSVKIDPEDYIRIVKEDDEVTYWERQDTVTSLMYSSGLSEYLVFKYLPLYYSESDLPSFTGFSSIKNYLPCYYVNKTEGGYVYPMIDLFFKSGNSWAYYLRYNNKFNGDYIYLLDDTDTLLVHEYNIELSRL